MASMFRRGQHARGRSSLPDRRLRIFAAAAIFGILLLCERLFALQVLSHDFYAALASNEHDIFHQLFPQRGAIYVQDPKSPDGRFAAAVNKELSDVYADPRQIKDAPAAAKTLTPLLGGDEADLLERLTRPNTAYVPLKKKAADDLVAQVKALGIKGIGFASEQYRYYPEKNDLSQVVGFVGSDEKGERTGRYGVEGYWNDELTGTRGTLAADPLGGWIGAAGHAFSPATGGDDITLTIDRNIQYVACEKLRAAVAKHGADSGSLIIENPQTGAILAMCNVPDFDPNDFSNVANLDAFNNASIFAPYEPGSIFKPITMAAGIDAGKVSPNTTYEDTGAVTIGPYTIRNSDLKAHGTQTMMQVLDESLNTGTIFVVRQLGPDAFRKYVQDFGFGATSGIELSTESPGNVDALSKKGEIWSATSSFGQGISVTPIQMISAVSAIANGGKLMKPYIVGEVRRPDGTTDETQPRVVRQVITKRTAALVSAMLVDVVEHGHGKRAAVPGYYVAGKTGTAQIPRADGQGYEKDASIGSFVGFAPLEHPAFVMLVKMVRPKDVQWAESSAGPLFGDIAKFLLQYMEIPPDRH